MEPLLKAEKLTKTFKQPGRPDFTALDQVSFELMPGECLGILGESGSGKSTLANIVTRLLDVTEGQIILEGKDITKDTGNKLKEAYKKMQMVFQLPTDSFDPRCTLGDGICESLRNHGVPKAEAMEKAKALLVDCGLPADYVKKYPHQVSGGECQRAAIARALAVEPKILICDEATSSLDVTIQKEVIALLTRLKKERKMSYIFICHDVALAQSFCDRMIVLYRGKIVCEGTPDEIIANPGDDYTTSLINSIF